VARVGLLGGTFNPPHVAHLVCAQEAAVQLELDRVLLVPAALPPHKAVDADPGIAHRLAMCEAAAAGDERIGVSRADADRDGPAYTVELLRALTRAAPEDELTFIAGGDMAATLPAWREPDEILRLAALAVVERDGAERAVVEERLARLPAARGRVRFLELPRIDISSSLVRRRAAAGLPLRYWVPDAVAEYIERNGIYRGGAAAAGAPDGRRKGPAYP
jgi:nicotinate-nucleotide adenylyltransferase